VAETCKLRVFLKLFSKIGELIPKTLISLLLGLLKNKISQMVLLMLISCSNYGNRKQMLWAMIQKKS
jgi:hypothetical protein